MHLVLLCTFLSGNSATFLGSIMTLAVLCFFGSDNIEKNSNNFIQNLLLIICKRTKAFLSREGDNFVDVLKKRNYKVLYSAIAKSKEENNPRKQEMLSLVNELQFLTVEYQTSYFTLRDNVDNLYKNITKAPEFLSSFFYSFLFCIFIFIFDCFGGSIKWCIDTVSLVSITSFIYWLYIWSYYWISIKERNPSNGDILYEFKLTTCIKILFSLILSTFVIGLLPFLGSWSMTIVYVLAIIVLAIGAIFKFKKKGASIFTHYFNLIHFTLILLSISILSILYNVSLDKELIFNETFALISSISFAIFSGLFFPLFVPLLRFRREITKSIKKFKESTEKFKIEDTKKSKELEEHFSFLLKLRSLDPSEHIKPEKD